MTYLRRHEEMGKYPLSHMVRMQRVSRIRMPWLRKVGDGIEELETGLLALVRYHKAHLDMKLWQQGIHVPYAVLAEYVDAKAALSDRVKRMLSEDGDDK